MKCRGCKDWIDEGDSYITTSVRHNYHWNCALSKRTREERIELILRLPLNVVANIPWKIPEQWDIVEVVERQFALYKANGKAIEDARKALEVPSVNK